MPKGSDFEGYGLFQRRGEVGVAWVDEGHRLGAQGVSMDDVLEYRPRRGQLKVRGVLQASMGVEVEYGRVCELAEAVVRSIGPSNIMKFQPDMERKIALLPADAQIVDLALPSSAVFSVISACDDVGALDATDAAQTSALYVWVPYFRGWMQKKGNSGLVKAWRKRWFVLQLGRLSWYVTQSEDDAMGFIHVADFCGVEPASASDAASRRSPDTHFQIAAKIPAQRASGNTRKAYQLLAPSPALRMQWERTLNEWLKYQRFFQALDDLALREPAPLLPSLAKLADDEKTDKREEETVRRSVTAAALETATGMAATKRRLTMAASTSAGALACSMSSMSDFEREVRVVDRFGGLHSFIVDADSDVYDLAFAVTSDIGSANTRLLGMLDVDASRTVDLLDHSKALSETFVPTGSLFEVRRDMATPAESDAEIIDHHFLFVHLPMPNTDVVTVMPTGASARARLRVRGVYLEAVDEASTVIARHNLSACALSLAQDLDPTPILLRLKSEGYLDRTICLAGGVCVVCRSRGEALDLLHQLGPWRKYFEAAGRNIFDDATEPPDSPPALDDDALLQRLRALCVA